MPFEHGFDNAERALGGGEMERRGLVVLLDIDAGVVLEAHFDRLQMLFALNARASTNSYGQIAAIDSCMQRRIAFLVATLQQLIVAEAQLFALLQ